MNAQMPDSPQIESPLEQSRAALRQALGHGPDERASELFAASGTFPRSKTMRFLLDPKYSWVRVSAMTVVAALVQRRIPRGYGGTLLAGFAVLRRFLKLKG